ncbi:MAG: tripartite tricarboxylate transporter permease [candidate division NC10 bacterium]|nr:tripartite tricarboxylate transporter permease [candidate division NC10 bacterium]MBI4391466.1 tripartite tricarboxylate transporter permease [candidate division NC10 bacterium]
MEILASLTKGFGVALTPVNLLFTLIGTAAGTVIGVLPGIGPVAGVAMLIPFSYGMNPTTAMIMMAGVYYGAMYGGSTTAILLNLPGESSSVVTCLDGYQMARQGRAGPALGMAAFSSFIGGTLSVVGLMVLAPLLAAFALRFGPPEYFALALLGITLITSLGGRSPLKGLLAGAFGVFLGTLGTDPMSAVERYTFDQAFLADGLSFVSVSVGLFAVAEVLENAERGLQATVPRQAIANLLPTLPDWVASRWAILRGAVIGFVIGVLPGAGATIASLVSYTVEKRCSRHPERFGTGVIEGVAAPEGANNAATGGALVPLLTLGIPGSGTTAVMLGALMIQGLRPGPLLFERQPDFVWGLIASMYVGNVMLLVLNLPLVGLWARLLTVPSRVLLPLILTFSVVGVFSVSNHVGEVWVMLGFGVIGYGMRKAHIPAAPVVLALVLTPLLETALQQSLQMSRGSFGILFTRPIAGALMAAAALSLALPLLPALRRTRARLEALSSPGR